jgi:hypothetical protein
MLDRQQSDSVGPARLQASTYASAVFLAKLAKHLALIACLMIAGAASGRVAAGEMAILITVVAAAILHSIGLVLDRRLSPGAPFSRSRR